MRFDDFVAALREAGWRNDCDAQCTEILILWRKLFPALAAAEDEIAELQEALLDQKRSADHWYRLFKGSRREGEA